MSVILVVEDEANIRKFVCVNLWARGHQVVEAASAEEGLSILIESRPNAMLLDIKLPGMSGWDLMAQLSLDGELSQIPVVVMTAHILDTEQRQTQFTNLVDILFKPLSISQLITTVNIALQGSNTLPNIHARMD